MLIEIDRAASSRQLAHGWWAGRYWRAVIPRTWGWSLCRQVYIQVLVPVTLLEPGMDHVATIPVAYHSDVVLVFGAYRTRPEDGGLPHDWNWQWIEVYYGTQRNSHRLAKWVAADMQLYWYPGKPRTLGLCISVKPRTFMQHLQPASQYLCSQFALIEKDPNYSDTIVRTAYQCGREGVKCALKSTEMLLQASSLRVGHMACIGEVFVRWSCAVSNIRRHLCMFRYLCLIPALIFDYGRWVMLAG